MALRNALYATGLRPFVAVVNVDTPQKAALDPNTRVLNIILNCICVLWTQVTNFRILRKNSRSA